MFFSLYAFSCIKFSLIFTSRFSFYILIAFLTFSSSFSRLLFWSSLAVRILSCISFFICLSRSSPFLIISSLKSLRHCRSKSESSGSCSAGLALPFNISLSMFYWTANLMFSTCLWWSRSMFLRRSISLLQFVLTRSASSCCCWRSMY